MKNTNPEQQKREFKGIWIPKEIYLDNRLNWTDKILLVEIDSLSGNKGCFASNAYFAKFLSVSETIISKSISKLKKFGYIEQTSFDGRKRTLQSRLELKFKADLNQSSKQDKTEFQDSLDEKFKYINTSINIPIDKDDFSDEKSYICPICKFDKQKLYELISVNEHLHCPYCDKDFDIKTLEEIKPKSQATDFLKWYKKRYEEEFKEPIDIVWQKDTQLVKGLLKTFRYDILQQKAELFLKIKDDDFINGTGHTIGKFKIKINALRKDTGKVVIRGPSEGFYAYK